MQAARVLTEDDWLRERSYLQEHRYDLAVEAAGEYPADRRVAGLRLHVRVRPSLCDRTIPLASRTWTC